MSPTEPHAVLQFDRTVRERNPDGFQSSVSDAVEQLKGRLRSKADLGADSLEPGIHTIIHDPDLCLSARLSAVRLLDYEAALQRINHGFELYNVIRPVLEQVRNQMPSPRLYPLDDVTTETEIKAVSKTIIDTIDLKQALTQTGIDALLDRGINHITIAFELDGLQIGLNPIPIADVDLTAIHTAVEADLRFVREAYTQVDAAHAIRQRRTAQTPSPRGAQQQ